MVSPERLEAMQKEWVRLMGQFQVEPAKAYPVFDELVAAHSAPERHYHNLEHLAEMFRVAGRLANQANDPAALFLAIWFHDAIYDPKAKDNEARSADYSAASLASLGVPVETIQRVGRLIHATAHFAHNENPPDRDTAIMLDADLAILGSAETRYRRYSVDIRKEYSFVPDAEYAAGRAAVLRAFLTRPRIYLTSPLFAEGEERARTNLLAELNDLAVFE